ncbi:uncharacterized protein LOC115231336 [Octopus sinensis]|uniref:Uncharacterized protein LOC115231181 n=1 Tax=Octopus sinensis TaxID=2607531 RepID=A0A6P7TZM0_9MOLL|nr:uncharacterized protein LOC115231181 [Octopus sinensis]XP_029657243.1 uncharacterized protein LOC115231336 [Octopus sinensis]
MAIGTPFREPNSKQRGSLTSQLKENFIEVGVTSQDRLNQVEVEKFHKYDLLANELLVLDEAKVKIIPIVLTRDGVISKFFKSHMDKLSNQLAELACREDTQLNKIIDAEIENERKFMENSSSKRKRNH